VSAGRGGFSHESSISLPYVRYRYEVSADIIGSEEIHSVHGDNPDPMIVESFAVAIETLVLGRMNSATCIRPVLDR